MGDPSLWYQRAAAKRNATCPGGVSRFCGCTSAGRRRGAVSRNQSLFRKPLSPRGRRGWGEGDMVRESISPSPPTPIGVNLTLGGPCVGQYRCQDELQCKRRRTGRLGTRVPAPTCWLAGAGPPPWCPAPSPGFPDASVLLRTLLVHLAGGCSLQEAVTDAKLAGWCDVSAVALFKRLRRRRLAALDGRSTLATSSHASVAQRLSGRAIDATTVSVPGSVGTDWRLHFGIDLERLQCDFFEVTDAHGGETFQRVPVTPGDLLLGDRVYATPPGIAHVAAAGGHVLRVSTTRPCPCSASVESRCG